MKKYFKSLFVIVATSAALLACNKETPIQVGDDSDALVELTIIAHNPEAQPATKTEMVGTTPYWSVGDAIGVSDGTSSSYKFTADIEETATTASFTGSATSGTLFAYYPYTSNGVGTIGEIKGAKVDLPANQNPTATSFDGKADVMVAKQFTVDPANTVVKDLEFARLGAVVKIVLIDKNNTMTGVQHPTTVSMTAGSDLAGRVLIDMENQELNAPYYNQSSTVTANYTTETKYEINGSNATYLIVYPQTLAEGSKLTIAASTEDYTLSKEITVPSGGIELLPGKITTLKVSFAANNITSDSGADLPFDDDFSWQEKNTTSALTSVDDRYSAFSNVYPDKGAGTVRIGTSNATGYLTTQELNLSNAFYVIVSAYAYNANDGSKIQVVVDGETSQTASVAMTSTEEATDYIFNFSAATKKSKVKITTDKKRAVLTGVQIIRGTYVFPPAINVTTNNPMAVGNTASSQTIEYTIDNPTTATLTASTTASWISNINYATSGKVTFEVATQETGASARTGVITLRYSGAPDVEVTVNQAAGPSLGSGTSTLIFTKACGGSGTADDGVSWTVTSDGDESSFDSTKGIHYGTNSNQVQYINLSTSGISGTITKVVVNASTASGVSATASVTVGGATFGGDPKSLSTTATDYTFNGSASGDIVVTVTKPSKATKALYVKSVVVTYTNTNN